MNYDAKYHNIMASDLVSELNKLTIDPVPRIHVCFSVKAWNRYNTIGGHEDPEAFIEWYQTHASLYVEYMSDGIKVDEVGFNDDFYIILSGHGIHDPKNGLDSLIEQMLDPDEDGNHTIVYNSEIDKIVCVNMDDRSNKIVYDEDSKVSIFKLHVGESDVKLEVVHGETCLVTGYLIDYKEIK